MGRALGSLPVVLDGVIIALGAGGGADRRRLDRRDAARSDSAVRRLASQVPATFLAFDVLWLDGHATTALPYDERRQLLDGIRLHGDRWDTPSHHVGAGEAMLAVAAAQGLPGIVAKRLDRPYQGGQSPDWVRVASEGAPPTAE
jgi:bifunctional non-homologous end joining protein LigD